jgi:hypothetical protein
LQCFSLALLSSTAACAAGEVESGEAIEPIKIDKLLVAYWTFDEEFGGNCLDASGHGCDASPERTPSEGLERIPGLFGNAMTFSGNHLLRVREKLSFGTMPKLSLSAWTRPTELSKYREIFRKEDGGNRVLFSYQDDGQHLSLGLNINGYVECDAKINPAQVLDGNWHHCVATFDGKFMRVYLDGKQIGALQRPGVIFAGGAAPGCIGSMNGGECFQGDMDDLRIYRDAMTAEEVAQIYQNGVKALAKMSEAVEAGETKIDKPLLAHWAFNERGVGAVVRGGSGCALDAKASRPIPRIRGVYGNALDLRDRHALKASGFLRGRELSKITFSAWIKPTDLKGNREIFRQECADRLLFSCQDNGTALSLGLNVGGYEECDAPINPATALDGGWHHCAGTFDGEFMRVYLDGKEVGSLKRPGRIAVRPDVLGFIGSSSGQNEYFQGALDDLRIYADALTPQEIAFLYRSGVESLDRISKELEKAISSVYSPGDSFAETVARTRKNIVEKGGKLDRELTGIILARLKIRFPAEYDKLVEWTGASPIEYLIAKDKDFYATEAERFIGLLLEYKPLTERQWKKQTPEDLRKWKEAERIKQRFDTLKARGASAQFLPEWIDLIFEAAPRIQFRPRVREGVAPYVWPETPETRSLSGAEAREVLEKDWLHQADQNPTPERIKNEIEWARHLAERIQSKWRGCIDFAGKLSELSEMEKQTGGLHAPSRELYIKVREIKRQMMFSNPTVDFDQVLFVDMPFPQGSEWNHETRHRLGYMAVPSGRLLILKGLRPDGRLRQLMPQTPFHGSFWRPDLSYDAKQVIFCFKPHNEKSFHLYEVNVDGSGLTQLTDGSYDDLDPIYLPDEQHIIFSTTRGHTYVRCMPPTNAYILARCDRNGKNIYVISANNEPDYLPSVMNDGRVIYTRWEYTDKPLWRAQALWTINPDGTQVNTFWGNQSVWPDLLKDARSIPGSQRVMFTGSAHHGWFSGSVGIIAPEKGFNFPYGLTKITADVAWPESGNGPVDPIESPRYHKSGSYSAYYSPYPLGEQDFLVSANRNGKFVLYLMDVDGNRELIYEGTNNILHALPLKPREKPPIIPDRVAWPDKNERLHPKNGVIFSGNVYQGASEELRGKARFLRVLHVEPKTYTYWYKRPYISTGPVVSAVQSEGVKRVLGTVPIEKDGSVAFYAPPVKALHFQLLDEDYRALQTMRSFVGVMPGEYRGCLGCHESHSRTPEAWSNPIALRKTPREITPPPWGEDTVSYPRYVQPVLDKYCGKCHEGDGKARKVLDLTERPSQPVFTEPYLTLIGRPTWGKPYDPPKKPLAGWGIAGMIMVEAYGKTDPRAYATPKPMTSLSYKSRLIEMVASRAPHHGVKMDPISLQRLIAWVDAMCPYCGDEEVREIPDPDFQGVDWLAIRPKIKNAPRVVRPGPVD